MPQFTHHILDIGWSFPEKSSIPTPAIKLKNLETSEITKLWLENSYKFNWQLSSERYCVGYNKDGEYFPCRFKNTAENGRGQCPYCSKQLGFEQAFFFGGEPNEYMQKYLAKPHYVYLAYFEPGIIKVGTAVEHRRELRTIEQDALVALIIAESDGFNIQAIEKAISKLGYPEAVSSRHKKKYISRQPSLDSATSELNKAYQDIMDKLSSSKLMPLLFQLHSKGEFNLNLVNHLENPHLFFPEPEKIIKFLPTSDTISGNFLGLRGKYLLVDSSSKIFGLNKSRVIGRELHIPEEQLSMGKKAGGQRSLF